MAVIARSPAFAGDELVTDNLEIMYEIIKYGAGPTTGECNMFIHYTIRNIFNMYSTPPLELMVKHHPSSPLTLKI